MLQNKNTNEKITQRFKNLFEDIFILNKNFLSERDE